MNYNMNNLEKTLMTLHAMLKTTETSMIKNRSSNPTAPVFSIGHGSANKKKKFSHANGKAMIAPPNQGLNRKVDSKITPNIDPKGGIRF